MNNVAAATAAMSLIGFSPLFVAGESPLKAAV
jgi:hypothetical protein